METKEEIIESIENLLYFENTNEQDWKQTQLSAELAIKKLKEILK